MSISKHKRGDVFDYSDQLAMTIDGVETTDFTGMTGASKLRHTGNSALGIAPGALVATLVFTWLDAANGLYRLHHNGPTNAWPTGVVKHDIGLTTAGGDPISTLTELIQIEEGVTNV